MEVLLDIDRAGGPNAEHRRNPRNVVTFNAKQVSGNASPGVSSLDHGFRDPWGNQYVITLDVNDDNKCVDYLYGSAAVHNNGPGLVGLVKNGGVYELNRSVMIWSKGPDGQADKNKAANVDVNKDNVLSWQ
jgi:hypothetical protein